MTRRLSHNDAFVAWLARNRRRFPTPLVLRRKRANGARQYWFPASPSLRVDVFDGEVRVAAVHERQIVDFLIDLDIEVKRDADGMYFCKWCADNGHFERFPTRTDLYTAHTFEPFLEWCLRNLREDLFLVMENMRGHWYSAAIRDAIGVEKHRSPDVVCIVKKVLGGKKG